MQPVLQDNYLTIKFELDKHLQNKEFIADLCSLIGEVRMDLTEKCTCEDYAVTIVVEDESKVNSLPCCYTRMTPTNLFDFFTFEISL